MKRDQGAVIFHEEIEEHVTVWSVTGLAAASEQLLGAAVVIVTVTTRIGWLTRVTDLARHCETKTTAPRRL